MIKNNPNTKKTRIALSLSILLFAMNNCFSKVEDHLNEFFDNLGYQDNVTKPASYQGQAAGYYTGGSLYLRNQVRNYQLVSIELPSFSGGCSGIDTYLGSFSVINSDQLSQMMKRIMSAGGAYALDLALTTTLPQVKSVKDYLQKYVNDINNMNINSCNMAEDLVGGIWPKTQASQQQICQDVSTHNGIVKDWASARQGCGTGGKFDEIMKDAGDRKAEVIVNKNLVWDSLMQNQFSSGDKDLSQVLMSLSGTIIVRNNNNKPQLVTLPSLIDQNFLRTILYGGQALTSYTCDEYKNCLNPQKKSISIPKDKGLVSQVSKIITELNHGVKYDNGELSPTVKGFLEMTHIPIMKIISTEASLGMPFDTVQYSEIIAISILDQYLNEDLKIVKEALAKEDTPMDAQMQTRIESTQIQISRELNAAYKKLENSFYLTASMRALEQQLSSRLQGIATVGQESR